MESNANDTFSGTSSASNTGSSEASFARDTASESAGLADRAREVGSQVRERAGSLKHSLADALESGAERLRTQGAGAVATAGATEMVVDESRLAQTSNQVAGGMQGAAAWLRDADLDGLKSSLETQIKEHPARTLAIAVGVGYLLGKALRK